jgi:hypothetical protein
MSSLLQAAVGCPESWYLDLRKLVEMQIQGHPLVKAITADDAAALNAYVTGFWPHVRDFPAIAHMKTVAHGHNLRRAIGNDVLWRQASDHLWQMDRDEGNHANLWRGLAASAGIALLNAEPVPTMRALLGTLESLGFESFLVAVTTIEVIAHALAGSVVITPELARYNLNWFNVHLGTLRPRREDLNRWFALRLLKIGDEHQVEKRFRTDALGTLKLFTDVADELWLRRA